MRQGFSLLFSNYQKLLGISKSNDLIIVAISGGIDSVVLTHLFKECSQHIVLAHCNFNLRGAESLRDEQFVRTLAAQWELPLYVESYDTASFAREHKLNTQVAARQLRYDFFERLRQQLSGQGQRVLIATAHHANDSAETLLINLFRGTGIDGLTGIPIRNGHIIRPLLFAGRHQIENYAQVNNLRWVEDSSNEKEDYSRNYIRQTVIPAIEKEFPSVINNLLGTAGKVKAAAGLYHKMITQLLKRLVEQEGDLQKVPVLKLKKQDHYETILWEWIRHFGFTEGQLGEVEKLMEGETGSYIKSATHRILLNRGWLILAPLQGNENSLVVIDQLPARVGMGGETWLKIEAPGGFDIGAGIPKLPANEILIDAALLKLPLILRPWKQGDYFYPLGMEKKKKIARFLIDQKLSAIEKEKVWVLESHQHIVWVVGLRIDNRFRITGKTKQVVSMKVTTGE